MYFSKKLLAWFDQHGRKHLPWQINKTPYRVWVSEIMLQQTQVSTATSYFQRFTQQLPDITSLAQAPEDEVLHLWSGLGYYSRARNLHRSAKVIKQEFNGELPADLALLQQLPGIGRSTAGAILASAFNQQVSILDGNVKRVLTRLHAITEWPGKKSVENQLWQLADDYTPSHRTADYTQAIMDFGATLCTPSKPRCHDCPFSEDCIAYQQQLTAIIPQKKATVILPIRKVTWLVLRYNDQLLLKKRPPAGIWGGLWSLPEVPEQVGQSSIRQHCRQHWQIAITDLQPQPAFRHTFSHFHLDIFPVMISLTKLPRKIMEDEQQVWYKLHNPQPLGMPAPVQSLLRSLP
ncbi:MAG: A/G-specific adenine glycosylase [Gammaproteobacteria bacterium RIFCSPHIGHO2_12_FULL_45_9]|nr:MAG: A/G-specific adenine glycosylase [Gammaproteobacteria bacterium RIFCSPHIGHO2_12_FULL_45_9]